MAKRKKRAAPVDWTEIRRIQKESFHGHRITQEEIELCVAALEEDRERYRKNEQDLKEEYRRSFEF